MPAAKRYALVVAVATFALFAFSALLSWIVDPFGKLGRNHIGIYNSSERLAKPQMIKLYPHDGLIVGTSRMAYIDPTTIKGYRLFNAAFSAATPEEILNFLQVYAVDQRLVILGLDFWMFIESFLPPAADQFAPPSSESSVFSGGYDDIKQLHDYLLSWNVVVNSVKATANAFFDIEPPVLLPAGNRNAQKKLADDALVTIPDDREAVDYWRTKTLANFQYSETRLDVLKNIGTLMKKRGIPMKVFITPDNESFINLIRQMNLYPFYLRFRAEVRQAFPESIDFSESQWSELKYRFKNDPGHFLPSTGAALIEDVLAGSHGPAKAP